MRFICLAFVLTCVVTFSGCSAKTPEKPSEVSAVEQESDDFNGELDGFSDEFEDKEVYDPFSGYNRAMTTFNDGAYEYVLKPVANGYNYVMHVEVRESVRNFFNNLYFPMRFVNNVLQGKFYYAAEETGRFVINTTVGILGLFDPAKVHFNLEVHDEDFGQTLGFYGVGSGPHIVLPIFGPSNLRDLVGIYPDSLLSPLDYTERSYWTLTDTWPEYLGAKTVEKVNFISLNMDKYEKMRRDAVDLYPYFRDVYEQYRNKQIEE
ncbi:MAG: VacJ family lipoprotein [Sulfurimonas sp.]|uniref:MlaA family lipoprotein n=1 Tax=Sulfurimonas sp. TaxID=2022749 RepID=UPI0028CC34E9|nr:VacJ family lipoprotein [Sulfurimonas sp.]MDT8339150.1 VacJ family lipoprotein [Sulfurimonas sp.]